MSLFEGRPAKVFFAACAVCLSAYAQQAPLIRGVVHKVGGPAVSHVEVRIETGGSDKTNDSGEFKLDMPVNLKPGMPGVFHITGWIIVKPCELKSGRVYLRDPSAEPIEFFVLKQGDAQLISNKRNLSIIGCLLEEGASQFEPKPKGAGGPRSALPKEPYPVFTSHCEKGVADASWGTFLVPQRYYLTEAEYHPAPPQKLSSPSAQQSAGSENPESDEFLTKKAKELGLTVEELKSAVKEWGKSVEDPYDKGLAALQDRRYDEASKYLSASIPEPPGAYLNRYVPLARAEYEQGHYAAAESALRKVLAVHNDDPVVLNNLAVVLAAQEKYSEAEPLCKRALAINETVLGPEGADTVTNLNNLAELYRMQRRYSEAEPLYVRSLAIDTKRVGPDHLDVAIDLTNLADLYREEGKEREAEQLYKRAIAINEKALGLDRQKIATSNLGLSRRSSGEIMAIDEEALGPDQDPLAVDLRRLASLRSEQGRYSEGEALLRRALAIDEKALGPDNIGVASDLNDLGNVCTVEEKYSEAEALHKRALAITEKALGPDHVDVAVSLNNLALVYARKHRYSEAEALYKRSLTITEKALGPDHVDVAITLADLGLVYAQQRKYSEAEALYKRSLAIKENAYGPDHPSVAISLNEMALLYGDQHKYSKAEPLYKRALAIDEKAFGPSHPRVARDLENLGWLYADQHQYSDAEPLLKQALAINRKVLGRDDPDVARQLIVLGLLLHQLGRDSEAEPYLEQAARIRARAK